MNDLDREAGGVAPQLNEERRICQRCGGTYWRWQSVLEHKPGCLYRRESERAQAGASDADPLDEWPYPDEDPPDPL